MFQVIDKIPTLKKIVQYSGEPSHPGVLSWKEVVSLGSSDDNSDLDSQLRLRQSRMAVNQCCCLVYTSGTTGTPKGVMLSHDNILFSTYREEHNLRKVHLFNFDSSTKLKPYYSSRVQILRGSNVKVLWGLGRG